MAIIFVIVVVFFAGSAESAGIDCSSANSPIELQICAHPELRKAENLVATLTQQAAAAQGHQAVEREQLGWLVYRDQCADTGCLLGEYQDRIAVLEATLGTINESDHKMILGLPGHNKSYGDDVAVRKNSGVLVGTIRYIDHDTDPFFVVENKDGGRVIFSYLDELTTREVQNISTISDNGEIVVVSGALDIFQNEGYAAFSRSEGLDVYLPKKTHVAESVETAPSASISTQQARSANQNKRGEFELSQRNFDEAIRLFEEAASAGNMDAMYNLGRCYQRGNGVRKNDRSAFDWFQKSAKLGHVDAHVELGAIYMKGRGVPVDVRKALNWYNEGAKLGSSKARYEYNQRIAYDEIVRKKSSGFELPVNAIDYFILLRRISQAHQQTTLAEYAAILSESDKSIVNIEFIEAGLFNSHYRIALTRNTPRNSDAKELRFRRIDGKYCRLSDELQIMETFCLYLHEVELVNGDIKSLKNFLQLDRELEKDNRDLISWGATRALKLAESGFMSILRKSEKIALQK